jgi:uncharacterized protein (DUF2336 family)
MTGTGMRQSLLQVLTDLYVQKPWHAPTEERQYVTLALRLIEEADADAKAAAARALGPYRAAPRIVLDRLQRDLSDVPSATLPVRAPQRVSPSQHEFSPLARSTPDFAERFFTSSSDDRRKMISEATAAELPDRLPGAVRFRDACRRLEIAALESRPHDFIRELAGALGIAIALTERIVNDSLGEPLVIAAKALDMPLDMVQRMLLLVNPAIGHSVKRVFDLSALYQDLDPSVAAAAIKQWRQGSGTSTARLRVDGVIPTITGHDLTARDLAAHEPRGTRPTASVPVPLKDQRTN